MDINGEYGEIELSKENVNKFSLDSLNKDRTYCITDDHKIVSYKINQDNDEIEKLRTMPIFQEFDGNNINISNGLLNKTENNILFLNRNNPCLLYQHDITKEKIMNEWKVGDIKILDICSMKKNRQTTNNPIIYGVSSKSIFSMDERINNKNNIVSNQKLFRKYIFK